MARRREDILHELVGLIISSLSHYDDRELEALLEVSSATDHTVVTQGTGIRAANNAVTAVLSPSASRSDILDGLRQLIEQLSLDEEDSPGQIRLDPTAITEAIYASNKLLN